MVELGLFRPQAEPATAGRRLIRRPRGGQRAKRAHGRERKETQAMMELAHSTETGSNHSILLGGRPVRSRGAHVRARRLPPMRFRLVLLRRRGSVSPLHS